MRVNVGCHTHLCEKSYSGQVSTSLLVLGWAASSSPRCQARDMRRQPFPGPGRAQSQSNQHCELSCAPSFIVNSLHLFMNLNCCLMQNNGSTLLYTVVNMWWIFRNRRYLLVSSGTFFKHIHVILYVSLIKQLYVPVSIALVLRKLQVATPTKSFLIRGILLTYVLHFKALYYAFIVLLFFDVRVRG